MLEPSTKLTGPRKLEFSKTLADPRVSWNPARILQIPASWNSGIITGPRKMDPWFPHHMPNLGPHISKTCPEGAMLFGCAALAKLQIVARQLTTRMGVLRMVESPW